MFNTEPAIDDLVESIVRDWRPRRRYDREHEYKHELESYLADELNAPNPDPPYQVSTHRSREQCDLVVDGVVGVELKRALDERGVERLRDELDDYLARYDVVIVCACGVADVAAWNALREDHTGGGLFGLGASAVAFVRKEP